MVRKNFACDFETTTDPNDCRVWAYAWMEVGNKKNRRIGTSLNEFMTFIQKCQGNLYFHNLKFDGEFIVNWLLKNGFRYEDSGLANTFDVTISSSGQWYKIDVCYGYRGTRKIHTNIYDSLKKLPFTIEKIAKAFKLATQKGEIDYHQFRPVGWEITDDEKEYILGDVEILADALKIQFDQGLKKMTAGQDSLFGFKSVISKKMFEYHFPIFSLDLDTDVRYAYRGGFTWLNKRFREMEIGEGIVFDVNSLYPSQMYIRPLPYGVPIKFDGKYEYDEEYPIYIQHIKCEFELKDGFIPTIQVKNKPLFFKENEYLEDSDGELVDLYLTNVDLELINEHYYLYNVEYIDGYKFHSKIGIFKDFIDKWLWIKNNSEGAVKELAKLMLNSLYGKFATNPLVTGKIPYLKEDGSCGFTLPKDEDGNTIDEYRDPVYTPMGVFITSWARYTTITTAQKCFDRIIYCDTDSIHLTGTEVPEAIRDIVDDKKLGYWKHESTFQRARYLRQKTYIQEIILDKPRVVKDRVNGRVKETNLKVSVKCAGMPDRIKKKVHFGNFFVGFSSHGKLVPKHVNGGVVLEDREFTIK